MIWSKIVSQKRMRKSTRNTNRDLRNEFESDYGRVVFSPAIRRMHDKTQVFPLITDDHIHTRLTHSLEVQSVAQSIGIALSNKIKFRDKFKKKKEDLLRIIPPILSTISLSHDIGNPPFGHFGEKVIGQYFKEYFAGRGKGLALTEAQKNDFILFDGNAQGFRILTKLNPIQDKFGLNLTAGTLSAYLKYPNLSDEIDINSNSKVKNYKNKLGVFQSEKETLEFIRKETHLKNVRNPLAFLMEAADSICYLVMDLEDGFNKSYYTFDDITKYLLKKLEGKALLETRKYINYLNKKIKKPVNKEKTKMVSLRVFLIQQLVDLSISRFLSNLTKIEKGTFTEELIYSKKNNLSQVLDGFIKTNIFQQREIQSLELTGKSVLRGLLDHFVEDFINYKKDDNDCAKSAKKLLSIISGGVKNAVFYETQISDLKKLDDYYKLRMIIDYISGMTDQFALKLYQKLQGIRLV